MSEQVVYLVTRDSYDEPPGFIASSVERAQQFIREQHAEELVKFPDHPRFTSRPWRVERVTVDDASFTTEDSYFTAWGEPTTEEDVHRE